jgi:parvulin-like peptidyl-prolyl isomerase
MVVLALAAAVSAVSCKKDEAAADKTTTAASQSQTKGGDEAVLDINGEKLKIADVENAAKELPPEAKQYMETPFGRRALGDELVRMKILEQEGHRLNVEKDPEVDRAIKFETGKVVAAAALKKLATPNDTELRQRYEQVKGQYDLLQAKQLVFAYKGGQLPSRHGAAPTMEGAVKKAEAAIAGLKSGQAFESFLGESDDPRVSETKGAIGFLAGAAPEQIVAGLANLKPGDISAPIRTTIGVHVFQLISRQPEPFDRVKPALEQRMRSERAEKVIDDLKKKAKVTYDERYFGPEPPANTTGTMPSTTGAPAPAPPAPPQQ